MFTEWWHGGITSFKDFFWSQGGIVLWLAKKHIPLSELSYNFAQILDKTPA